ncbi:hypothetical protein [Zhihengliuella halotolerans]|uniref:Uncharacterized protein n=1 Tax=Zhihengliuella halotolerans TaxID=370736 RepID=A0A4Q8AGN3_9MICC|nr:hypothetical protein [Zhihengliuella halotolerans]RZU63478.1 hypothetical protein EV380_3099 [Zhihengliuella halotolerans]
MVRFYGQVIGVCFGAALTAVVFSVALGMLVALALAAPFLLAGTLVTLLFRDLPARRLTWRQLNVVVGLTVAVPVATWLPDPWWMAAGVALGVSGYAAVVVFWNRQADQPEPEDPLAVFGPRTGPPV